MLCVLGKERSPLPSRSSSLHCLIAAVMSAASMTVKGRSPSQAGFQRRRAPKAKAWKVPPCTPASPWFSSRPARCSISRAALRVKVSSSIASGETLCSASQASR